jgi:molybdenum cofactor cytidylyltransferase
MGQPKLLLPWGDSTILERVLAVWHAAGVERRIVVVHPADRELAARAAQAGAEVVVPAVPPPDMKASVQAALQHLEGEATDPDIWLLAPADMPTLSPDVIKTLLQAARQSFGTILVPTVNGRRGHPVLFRWPMSAAVATLAADQGVNELLRQFPVTEVSCEDEAILADVDTQEDYQRLRP